MSENEFVISENFSEDCEDAPLLVGLGYDVIRPIVLSSMLIITLVLILATVSMTLSFIWRYTFGRLCFVKDARRGCSSLFSKFKQKLVEFVLKYLKKQPQNNEGPIQVAIYDNSSSESSEDNPFARRITQVATNRRRRERRTTREGDRISISNIEAISQRLGQEAADRFRVMIENRRRRTTDQAAARIDTTWLGDQLSDDDLNLVEDETASNIKTIVSWYGPIIGSIVLRMNNSNIALMKCDIKTMAENRTKCMAVLITKLFPNDLDFTNELKKFNYYNTLYCLFPNIKSKIKSSNYTEKEIPIMKLILDASTHILKHCDGPYFKRYRKTLISKCITFYKFLHRQDKQVRDSSESKLSKRVKNKINKAISSLEEPKQYIKQIKSRVYLSKSNKEMVRFYKSERSLYDDFCMLAHLD